MPVTNILKNGIVTDATDAHSVWFRSSIIALANNQKAVFKADGNIFNFQSMGNLSDGGDYIVDGFGTVDTYDGTNTTLVIDNEDVSILDNSDSRFVTHRAYNCKTLDNFNDSSVDGNIWSTTGTVTEATLTMNFAGSSTAIADQVNAPDFRSFSNDSEIVLHFSEVTTGSNQRFKVQISNGATHVDIVDNQLVSAGERQDTIKIKIDFSAEEAFVSLNGGAFGGAIDISSATTNWYLRFITTATSVTSLFFVGYIDEDGSTVDYVSATKTFGATKTAGVLTWDYNGTDSDIAGNLSSNSGSNYSSVTKNIWTDIGTTSTGGKIKLVCTTPSSIDATSSVSDIKELKAVGAYFEG